MAGLCACVAEKIAEKEEVEKKGMHCGWHFWRSMQNCIKMCLKNASKQRSENKGVRE